MYTHTCIHTYRTHTPPTNKHSSMNPYCGRVPPASPNWCLHAIYSQSLSTHTALEIQIGFTTPSVEGSPARSPRPSPALVMSKRHLRSLRQFTPPPCSHLTGALYMLRGGRRSTANAGADRLPPCPWAGYTLWCPPSCRVASPISSRRLPCSGSVRPLDSL